MYSTTSLLCKNQQTPGPNQHREVSPNLSQGNIRKYVYVTRLVPERNQASGLIIIFPLVDFPAARKSTSSTVSFG
jgi:hypothetical protein